ncbi:MAG TPA: type II secretion system F family protein [Bryobacteraceae bacterium]|jgi:tight adherence protein B|nr:type II secretion system F family protein [Bryobacteraceae bacterium]
MSTVVALCFLVIFALLLFSISFALRFYENKRRKKLVSMLRTVTENGEERHVNLLIDNGGMRGDAEGSMVDGIIVRFTRILSESGLDWTPTRLAATMGVAFMIGAIASAFIPVESPPLALRAFAAGLCTGAAPLWYVNRKRGKRIDALEAQLPDALDFLARSMRAGHAFAISLEMVGEEIHEPLGQEFRALFNEQNLGASLDRSLASFARRVPITDVRFFNSAVLLQRQTGGNLSEILNRLSHIIRERFRLKGQVRAVSAHGRLTATILTILPLATLGGLMVTSPSYLDPMFHTPIGRKLLMAGAVAMIIGNMVIRKIVKIKV